MTTPQPSTTAPILLTYHTDRQVPADWTHITYHALDPAGKFAATCRILTLAATVQLLLIAGGIVFLIFAATHGGHFDLVFYILWSTAVFAGALWGLVRVANRARRRWDTYHLILADQGLLRMVADLAPLEIRAAEVKRIQESRYGLIIRPRQRMRSVSIPRDTQDYAGLRERVAQWTPIQPLTYLWLKLLGLLIGIIASATAFFAVYTVSFLSPHLWVTLLCSAIITTVAAVFSILQFCNPNVTLSQKIASSVALCLLALVLWIKPAFMILHLLSIRP